MNSEWINFLKPIKTINSENISNMLTAISDLTLIEVSGKDNTQFLQGQLTCNVNELTEINSFFAAFCNAKGKIISTLLILKHNDNFLLILPVALADKVINKLKTYVLRADIQLNTALDKYCLSGLNLTKTIDCLTLPNTDFEVLNSSEIIIKLPIHNHRYLIISEINRGKQLWTQLTKKYQLSVTEPCYWKYLDISAGLAWLDEQSSEQYIPQMLNIDKLGGISFQKGCYTGQEIIARTHYLGKAKRELFLIECDKALLIATNSSVINDDTQQSIGKIISLQANAHHYRALAVLPTTISELSGLALDNLNQDKIKIIDFQ